MVDVLGRLVDVDLDPPPIRPGRFSYAGGDNQGVARRNVVRPAVVGAALSVEQQPRDRASLCVIETRIPGADLRGRRIRGAARIGTSEDH